MVRDQGEPDYLPNTPLQPDERRVLVSAHFNVTLAPLAAERQSVGRILILSMSDGEPNSDGGSLVAAVARLIGQSGTVLMVFGFTTSYAWACTCVADPLKTRFRKANAVFVGEAVNELPVQDLVQGNGHQTLSVTKAWKGITKNDVSVSFEELTDSPANCPTLYFFEQGQKYLVFAYGKRLQVRAVCSDTWRIPSERTSLGYEQMAEITRKLDSFWFRLRSRLRFF